MKKIVYALIAGSLALNAALAFLLVRGAASAGADASSQARPAPTVAASAAAPATPTAPAHWAEPKAEDLPRLVDELQAAGFPAETVRIIMTALVMDQFAARRKALDPDAATRAFWKDRAPDPKLQAAQTQLWRETQKVLRDLLGPDADASDPMSIARRREQFGQLPAEKLTLARDIVRTFDDKRQDAYRSGVMTAADQEKIRDLEKQQRAALAQVLTPAELEEYDVRNSNTGRSLRTTLSAFNPTEEEFRTIFRLQQPFDEQTNRFYDSGLPSQEEMNRRNTAEQALKAQIRAALGPVRGAEYDIATDYNYRNTSQLVARLELPPETTKQLWELQKEYQQKRNDLYRAGTINSREAAVAAMTTLHEEASTRAAQLLGGNRGLEAYKQYGGNWLQNMVPRPNPAAPAERPRG